MKSMHDEIHEHVHDRISVETERQHNLRHCQRQPTVDEAGISDDIGSQLDYDTKFELIFMSHQVTVEFYSRLNFRFTDLEIRCHQRTVLFLRFYGIVKKYPISYFLCPLSSFSTDRMARTFLPAGRDKREGKSQL